MNLTKKNLPSPRQGVLVVSHSDGYIEAFAEKNIDIYLIRVPVAHSRALEVLAEEGVYLALPSRYRQLYRADFLRVNGTTRPLLPSTAQLALATRDGIAALNSFASEGEESKLWIF